VVLCAALAELYPGSVEPAVESIPRRAVKYFQAGLKAVRGTLERTHPRAWEALTLSTGRSF
jgi:hypothetical protein